jgi:hypothetical protein
LLIQDNRDSKNRNPAGARSRLGFPRTGVASVEANTFKAKRIIPQIVLPREDEKIAVTLETSHRLILPPPFREWITFLGWERCRTH